MSFAKVIYLEGKSKRGTTNSMMKLLNTRTGYRKVGDKEETSREGINVRYARGRQVPSPGRGASPSGTEAVVGRVTMLRREQTVGQ